MARFKSSFQNAVSASIPQTKKGLTLCIADKTPIRVNAVLFIIGEIKVFPVPGDDTLAFIGHPYDMTISWLDLTECTNLNRPSVDRLCEMFDTCEAESVAGNLTELDGHDENGFPSWLRALSMI